MQEILERSSGKGGWDSGEIETSVIPIEEAISSIVERVDGTQARLKHSN